MNEVQIIRDQLAREKQHFAAAAAACIAAIGAGQLQPGTEFAQAAAEYFEFGLARLRQPTALESQLHSARSQTGSAWADFLHAFTARVESHYACLIDRARSSSVVELRALVRLDADSIVTERKRFARLTASMPAGIALDFGGAKPG